MGRGIKRYLSVFLAIVMVVQLLTGCSSGNQDNNEIAGENKYLYNEYIYNDTVDEKEIEAQYIAQNLILDDDIYQITIGEKYICQTYIIETVVTKNPQADLSSLLPEEIKDYEIDWPKVVGQFAVGTSIIISVGVATHISGGQTFWIFGSPADVAAEALIGGAIEATLKVMLECDEGEVPEAKVKKYVIEGFAEGYMYGAISGVLENVLMPNKLASKSLGKLKVDNWGKVKNSAGKVIGEALYDANKKQITLLDDTGKIIGFFNKNGNEIDDLAKVVLEANKAYIKGSGTNSIKCFTDAVGHIYRMGDELVPNMTYVLNGYKYQTDDLGRIVNVTFEKLSLRPEETRRANSLSFITRDALGKGYMLVADERGHIIGAQFNGADSIANIVPMSWDLNHTDYYRIETLWAEAIREGKVVDGTINLLYDGVSFRPSRLDVEYAIDGVKALEKLFN